MLFFFFAFLHFQLRGEVSSPFRFVRHQPNQAPKGALLKQLTGL